MHSKLLAEKKMSAKTLYVDIEQDPINYTQAWEIEAPEGYEDFDIERWSDFLVQSVKQGKLVSPSHMSFRVYEREGFRSEGNR